MGGTIRSQIEAAARKRGIDLAGDPEAQWCAGVLENAPTEAAQAAIGRGPFRVLELADALGLDPDSVNDVYSDWIINGGRDAASLPDWAFDKSETQPWRSDVGPPDDRGFDGISAPIGEPVRLPPVPRPKAAPNSPLSLGGVLFIGFVLLGFVGLILNLSDRSADPQPANKGLPAYTFR